MLDNIYISLFYLILVHLYTSLTDVSLNVVLYNNPDDRQVYMRLVETNHSWLYSYWFFYPYNGCSNQLLWYTSNQNDYFMEYFACNMGVHEGNHPLITLVTLMIRIYMCMYMCVQGTGRRCTWRCVRMARR